MTDRWIDAKPARVKVPVPDYNRADMTRACPICHAPPFAFCVATMHRGVK